MVEQISATILVVDDREENRYITARILRRAGFNVIEGRSGSDALSLGMQCPDLIVLDIRLPDMSGYDACKRLKANPATRSIPILHLSATFVSAESKVMSLEGGADAYLTQPVEPPVLVATVKALLRLGKAEAISRLSARQWQATFDSLSEGIGLLDTQGCIQRCNRAMAELLRKRYSEIEGAKVSTLLQTSLGLHHQLSVSDTAQSFETESAGRRWFRVSVNPIYEHDEELAGGIFILAEITDRKRAEESLRVNEQLAATGRLAHSIAHEINNPLEALTNLIYLLGTNPPKDDYQRYLSMANDELSRVSRITKQTLAFHRESSVPVRVDVRELFEGVLLMHGPQLSQQGIDIRRQYDDDTVIEAFPSALQQVFSNLISNAMDATRRPGKITVRISHSKDWRNHDRAGLRISIADQGTGIPSAIKSKVFEAFFTTKEVKGSGLGLWLSSSIIQKHSGDMRLRSSQVPGKSFTCFSIFLPYRIGSNLHEADLGLKSLIAS